jgi:hypothetical protein
MGFTIREVVPWQLTEALLAGATNLISLSKAGVPAFAQRLQVMLADQD